MGRHNVVVSQRLVDALHTPLQQSVPVPQMSPSARQKLSKLQWPERHTPEQHWDPEAQFSPSVAQLPEPVHIPPEQVPLQHSTLVMHVAFTGLHVAAELQVPVPGSQ